MCPICLTIYKTEMLNLEAHIEKDEHSGEGGINIIINNCIVYRISAQEGCLYGFEKNDNNGTWDPIKLQDLPFKMFEEK